MPSKPNRQGNLQPYVPAGNGEESGEYREHGYGGGSGSTTTTTTTKKVAPPSVKPSSEKPVQTKEQTEQESGVSVKQTDDKPKKILGEGKEKLENYLKTQKKLKKENFDIISNAIKGADEDCCDLLAKTLEKHEFITENVGSNKSSYFRPSANGVFLSNQPNNKSRTEEAFFHEFGHAIDWNNDLAGEVERQTYFYGVRKVKKPSSETYVSKEHGKTLQEMIKEEFKSADIKGLAKRYQEELDVLIDKYLIEEGYSKKEYDDAILQQNKELDEVENKRKEIASGFYSGRLTYTQYKEKDAPFWEEKNQIRQKYKEITDANFNARVKAKESIAHKYSDISDMVSAGTKGRLDINGYCHSTSYWRKSPEAQAHEFFAEVYQAKSRNMESYSLVKEYFPKSVSIFEEILKENIK